MQFKVIRKSYKKSIVIGVSLLIILGVVLIARFTFAKYELVKSIKIAKGTINYKVPDFKMIAMYKNDGNGDTPIDTMPESGYVINETKSYCTLDNINKDTKAKLYTDLNGQHIISGLSKEDKCYLYFDKKLCKGAECILANVTVKDSPTSFTGVATMDEGIFKDKDDDGDTYYFRGAAENNYVRFAGLYWRIIRVNGDGSIRIIYDGETAMQNGESSETKVIGKSAFNLNYDNNMYVGFKYTSGEVHGTETESTILGVLNTWYKISIEDKGYSNKIDTNAGFCNDREPSTDPGISNGLGGTGTTATYFGAYLRIIGNTEGWNSIQKPTFKCKNNTDLFTKTDANQGNKSLAYPIGLITVDEIIYAGGLGGFSNEEYYLYTGQIYWTLSPDRGFEINLPNSDSMFVVGIKGEIGAAETYYSDAGVRPVINLRSDTKFTFTGTGEKGSMTNPYVVN